MSRRQTIGWMLAALVVVANVALWYARQGPPTRPPDPRSTIHKQLTSRWKGLPVSPIVESKTAIVELLRTISDGANQGDGVGSRRPTSFQTLSNKSRSDLLDALTDAIEAIAAGKPEPLLRYMRARGMELDITLIDTAAGPPTKALSGLFATEQVDPHWGGVVPTATSIRVWRPRSLRNVSMVQLGENESWVWDNETVFRSPFVSRPTFVEVSRREPALLADVRVLIEHDDALGKERSPYFFRFWRSEAPRQWRPLALKLVRTSSATEKAPKLVF